MSWGSLPKHLTEVTFTYTLDPERVGANFQAEERLKNFYPVSSVEWQRSTLLVRCRLIKGAELAALRFFEDAIIKTIKDCGAVIEELAQ